MGAFEAAAGGTLFLDEIGELPGDLQAMLLRALETRMVRRLGETCERKVAVRVVAATNRDLTALVRSGGFREDLYFRLSVVRLRVPSLREQPLETDHPVEQDLPEAAAAMRRARVPRTRKRQASTRNDALACSEVFVASDGNRPNTMRWWSRARGVLLTGAVIAACSTGGGTLPARNRSGDSTRRIRMQKPPRP